MNRLMALTMVFLAAAPCVADGVYVGKFQGGPESARIAIVVAGNRFVCYVCSDDQAFNDRYSQWMTGSIKKSGEATAAGEQVYLHTTSKDDFVRGGLQTADGDSIEFSALKTAEDSRAGLFRFVQLTDDDRVVDGWIVDDEGNVVGNRDVKARTKKAKSGADSKKVQKTSTGNVNASSASVKKSANEGTSSGSVKSKKNAEIVSSKKLGDKLKTAGKKSSNDGTNKKATDSDKSDGKGEKQKNNGVADADNQEGKKGKQKQDADDAAGAEENNQDSVAKGAKKLKQKVGKIKNVEQVNIIEQDENAAAEEEAAPQAVDVENVKIVNRIKPKNKGAGKANQGANAEAPLPGEVVEGTLTGVDDEERVLTVDDGQDVVEVPVGKRQMIVVDAEGERAAEEPANAAAKGVLKGKPGKMLKKLAASGDVPVRIRIGAKNVVVKQQQVEAE